MFRFIHCADIHLDSPLRGLDRYPGAPVEEIRGATREALRNLIRLALDEQVAFVLIAGDVYDGDWKDYNTGLFFASEMARLRAAGIPVFLVRGNHDAASQISRTLRLPDNVRELPTGAPGTFALEEHGVAIHGQGFAHREVREDLSAAFPEARRGCFNIGLLHTNVVGGRPGHENYAPSTLGGLASKGYDYWALGHVHERAVLCEAPWVVFPGNIQGRHVRETGEKGCTLVTVDGGEVLAVEHRALDVLRWAICDVTARLDDDAHALLDRVEDELRAARDSAGELPVAARVRVRGATRAHSTIVVEPARWREEFRALAASFADDRLWIEKVELLTRSPVDDRRAARGDEALGGLLGYIDEAASSDEDLERLAGELADLRRKLPPETLSGDEGLDLQSPEALRALLDDVRRLLVPRVLAGGDAP